MAWQSCPTATIRLDPDLRARVAAAAERERKTAHAFILNAIAQTVEQAEEDEAFRRVAEKGTTLLDLRDVKHGTFKVTGDTRLRYFAVHMVDKPLNECATSTV